MLLFSFSASVIFSNYFLRLLLFKFLPTSCLEDCVVRGRHRHSEIFILEPGLVFSNKIKFYIVYVRKY